ncbi:hypothetical protein BB558_000228 [Smittium angustum]|uniref:NADH dehydrogenase [ubiquinone] iron-sulfur protein 4, mitochondrial n=1 Tax=Smittium angustum TaxID=133377 RepID=A0A2U1JEM8_SMIAN|nr:hypothetical protein BB558_000228 [Smittium angustum]
MLSFNFKRSILKAQKQNIGLRFESTKIITSTLINSSIEQSAQNDVSPVLENRDPLIDILSTQVEGTVKNKVRIYRPALTVMQSGKNRSRHWQIDFDNLPFGNRWTNQLMGWQGSCDNTQSLRLKFTTKEQAIQFAEKQGWEYSVFKPNNPKFKPKSYKANFVYNPDKLRFIYTK